MADQPHILAEPGVVHCPTGLKVRVRGMKVRDERILTDKRAIQSGTMSTKLLEACVEEIIDHGPYSDPIDWRRVTQGDRTTILFGIRCESYGTELDVKASCPECRATMRARLDLLEDMEPKACPIDSIDHIRTGDPLSTGVAGAVVRFRLLSGVDEERVAKLRVSAATTQMEMALRLRIVSVEVDGAALKKGEIEQWVRDLSMRDARRLQAAFDEADCGIDTAVEVPCGSCGATPEIDVPLGREFWLPSA